MTGYYTLKVCTLRGKGCTLRKRKRLYGAEFKWHETPKKRSRLITGLKKGKYYKDIEDKGTMYNIGEL